MTVRDLLTSAKDSLVRTKARSALTMLGIIIGIMSVIVMLSIGEAAQRYILAQISSFGSDVMFVANGPEVQNGSESIFIKETLTLKDEKKLRSLPWVTAIAGKLFQNDQLTANGLDITIQLVGTMPDELRFGDLRPERGVFFDMSAVDSHARSVVLGNAIATKAFGSDDPVGKTIKISGQGFRVIGVMEKAGTKGFQNIDEQVYIPVTAALDLYNKKYVTYITLTASVPLPEAKERLRVVMRERHNIDNPTGDLSKDDFHIMTQEDIARTTGQITSILRILLISIAAISLLVGGIGIMNIMYVAVTERIREIGLRKSLGATRQDILTQFLVEAVIQTVAGGTIGIVLGTTFTWLGITIISRFQEGWSFAVSTTGIFWGLAVSAAIGIVFGYFPARRAAALNPIDALRVE